MSDTGLSDSLKGGAIAGGGLLIGILLVLLIIIALSPIIGGILWYMGIIGIQEMVVILTVVLSLHILTGGHE